HAPGNGSGTRRDRPDSFAPSGGSGSCHLRTPTAHAVGYILAAIRGLRFAGDSWVVVPRRAGREQIPRRCAPRNDNLSCPVLANKDSYVISSMRSSATLAQYFTSSLTLIWFTTFPSTRFSRAQHRCCGEMRNMVVHRHPESSSVITFFPSAANSLPMRLTR